MSSSAGASPSILRQSTGAANIGRAGSNVDADLTALENDKADITYVDSAVSGLVDSSPETLNTLNELADALGDDENFSTTVAASIATKEPVQTAATQAEAEAGTETAVRSFTPQRIAQAVAVLAPSSAPVLLDTVTVSASVAAADLVGFSSTYDDYFVIGENVDLASNQALLARLKFSGAWNTSAVYQNSTGSGVNGFVSYISIPKYGDHEIDFLLTIKNANSDRAKKIETSASGRLSTDNFGWSENGSLANVVDVVEGVRIYGNTIDIDAGVFRLYGVPK